MNKKDLLKEELKRHMQLLEYTFYMPEVEDGKEEDVNGELLLGDKKIYEQDPIGGEETEEEVAVEEPAADPFGDVGGDVGGEAPVEEPGGDPFGAEEEVEVEDEFAAEGGEETIEVDVTDIVDKTEATKTEVDGITTKMDDLISKFNDLEGQVTGMDQVINKIEGLEKEIERRNPTPVEKLEMMSLDSFPYSVKLSEYWKEQEGYDTGNGEEKEYTITQQEVDDYSSSEIKDSFDYEDDDEDY
tara:strand:- start:1062 stop:1790 length:729 start_codon:yes stop_codon:yes gene_type:complete